jgi:predicted dehydrogenase
VIRVGFVGSGNISQRHFGALAQLREQAEMLARERLDALYVCLPSDAHVVQELAAIERGIHQVVIAANRLAETGAPVELPSEDESAPTYAPEARR